ncbi:Bug family tripartite tricarboxylate transporter substrate binding protein [Bordetella genomosp. 9]|uniref:ABC transporter substrate-binding protein n=1 Tax=Bordetella genomosp. 9 TaxID=1416803 RepID=A0A1W6YZN9_9BORD|nr:tripartite tricarboxylate transporter substrate binding protein [Bordetella genomosp. 9]ARP86567.1 ABC transporter substrate-binding protein [Bordetella genomosp. 9]ARP90563.1 ABC transporter substrate-binding protein [Bordetella genomosp. 9]
MKTRALPAMAALLAAVCAPLSAHADDFPSRSITFVVPFAAASATDQIARALAQGVTEQTGQPVVIEDKPGASAMIGAQAVARAKPDGYTVLITTNTTHAANEHLYKRLQYDPVKDFEPLTLLGKGSQIMVVNPSFPAKTVAEFLDMARKEPGKLSFGSGSSSSRIAGELLQQMANVKLLHVPYKSNPLAVTDLMGGQISTMITDMATGLPQVQSGKLRALGVTTLKRSPLAPDVPTIAEAGVPGYEMGYWFAAYAPAGTPPAVVKRLNALLIKATESNAAKQFYATTGTEPATSTPAELAAFQKAESTKWQTIIKQAGIEPE